MATSVLILIGSAISIRSGTIIKETRTVGHPSDQSDLSDVRFMQVADVTCVVDDI